MGFSIQHLLLTLVIVVLIFGTKRFKNAGADLGDAIKGFRKAIKDGGEDGTNNVVSGTQPILDKEEV
jgi:sec-independent protein translocase protein TatA